MSVPHCISCLYLYPVTFWMALKKSESNNIICGQCDKLIYARAGKSFGGSLPWGSQRGNGPEIFLGHLLLMTRL